MKILPFSVIILVLILFRFSSFFSVIIIVDCVIFESRFILLFFIPSLRLSSSCENDNYE